MALRIVVYLLAGMVALGGLILLGYLVGGVRRRRRRRSRPAESAQSPVVRATARVSTAADDSDPQHYSSNTGAAPRSAYSGPGKASRAGVPPVQRNDRRTELVLRRPF